MKKYKEITKMTVITIFVMLQCECDRNTVGCKTKLAKFNKDFAKVHKFRLWNN